MLVDFSAVPEFVVVDKFRFVFLFVDAVSAVSAAAGALRFFACPKKVTKKMAFSFFLEKKQNKKSIQGSVLENPLALRWLSLGLVLDFWFVGFLFVFLFFTSIFLIITLFSLKLLALGTTPVSCPAMFRM
ncbi:MAG: hypothetical protein R3Y27_06345 [Clostridia bacterium]